MSLLAVGLLVNRTKAGLISLLAMPSACAGLGVAAYQTWLVVSGRFECPLGIFGLGTAPFQSLVVHVVLATLLGASAWTGRRPGAPVGPVLGVLAATKVLGYFLAWTCVVSAAPSIPPAQKPDPSVPMSTCRPVWQDPGP